MSLRFRLNLLITSLFIIILLGASSYLISNARHAVEDEMYSTAHLTLQLVEAILNTATATGQIEIQNRLLQELTNLESTRHLQIAVVHRTNLDQVLPIQAMSIVNSDAPGLFIQLVKPPPMEFRRIYSGPGIPMTEIVIRADPSDEITEVWYETRSVLFFLILFITSANVLVYLSLGRDLAPIESILEGLNRIAKGDYELRLPHFKLPELARISEKINHIAEKLLQSKKENRYLTRHSLAIQEEERRKLARELHDELGQSLSAIKAVAVSIDNATEEQNVAVKESARAIISFSERTYDVARNMMRQLRPSVLDELGLKTALQEMIDDWNERYGEIFCHLSVESDIPDLRDDVNINLYRIVQECLTNIARHANASEAYISFSIERLDDQDHIKLSIKDDGIGFNPGKTGKGLGILGMRERVDAMHGRFILHTDIDKGTEIIIAVPIGNTLNEHVE